MLYSSEESGVISGIISTYFSYPGVSEGTKAKYWGVHNRLLQDHLTTDDLSAIENALLFLAPCYRDNQEDHRAIMSLAFKTSALMQNG
jgi:hypothetical protein